MKRLLAITLAMVFIGAADLAQAADQPNPAGTWKWSVTFGGRTRETVLKLNLEGDKLTGVVARDGQETAIQDAQFKDAELSFSVVRERNGRKMTAKYSGKVSGDAINGKMEFGRDGQTRSLDWEAKREAAVQPAAAAPTSIAGAWNLSAEVEGATHEMTLNLKEDGDKLTGAIVDSDGNERAIKDAAYKDGVLTFTVVFERDGEDFPLKATAQVSGDAMKGKTAYKQDGEERSLTWEAKRPAAAKPADTAACPVGSWKLSIEINGEPREFTLKLKQDGDKLTGTLVDSNDKKIELKDVKCEDGDLSFTVNREQDGETMALKNSAKLTGDTMKGKVDFELDGQAQSLPWEAKRIKD
jgi:hypothetical protein